MGTSRVGRRTRAARIARTQLVLTDGCKVAVRSRGTCVTTLAMLMALATVTFALAAPLALASAPTQTLSGTAHNGATKAEVSSTLAAGTASGTLSTFAPGTIGGKLTALSPSSVGASQGTARLIVSADGKHVYATNRNTNIVSSYSRAASGALGQQQTVSLEGNAEPEGIVESPDKKNVYVADYGTSSVTELTRNGSGELQESEQIASAMGAIEGTGPIGIAISPDGTSLYVANSNSKSSIGTGAVSVYTRDQNSGTLTFQEEVPAGKSAHDVIVSPDGNNVYVANFNSNTVLEYERNSESGSLGNSTSQAAGTNPHALAMSPDGKSLYVTDSEPNGKVVLFARNGAGSLSEQEAVSAGEYTENVAVSPDGNSVYATSFTSRNLAQFSRNVKTGALEPLSGPAPPAGSKPEGIAASPDGKNIYVADYNEGNTGEVSQYERALQANKFEGTVNCMVVSGHTNHGPVEVTVEATGSASYAPGGSQAATKLSGSYRQVFTTALRKGGDEFRLLGDEGQALEVQGTPSCKAGSFAELQEDAGSALKISTSITAPTDGATSYSGSVTLAGATEPGAEVEVAEGAAKLGSTTANDNGEWSKTVMHLSQGVHTFLAKAKNGTAPSNTVEVDIGAPAISAPANKSIDYSGTLAFAGMGEPNAQIEIYEGSSIEEGQAPVASATTDSAGKWSTNLSAVSAGPHLYVARSEGSTLTSNVIEVEVVAPRITTPANNSGAQAGTLAFAGTGAPNAQIAIYEGSAISEGQSPVATTTTDSSGAWSTSFAVSAGSHVFLARTIGSSLVSSSVSVQLEAAKSSASSSSGSSTPTAVEPPHQPEIGVNAYHDIAGISLLAGSARLFGGRIHFGLRAPATIRVTVTGYVKVAGSARHLALRSGEATLIAGGVRVSFSMPAYTLRLVQRYRREHRRMNVWLTITLRGAAGGASARHLHLPLS